jgi:protein SCO1/2
MLSGLLGRVKLFCTVYDPTSGRYTFDYSLFIQITIGLMVVLTVLGYLIIEAVRARRRRAS